jgi:hypothetical protein
VAEKRDWLGRPIYRYARKYFEGLKGTSSKEEINQWNWKEGR